MAKRKRKVVRCAKGYTPYVLSKDDKRKDVKVKYWEGINGKKQRKSRRSKDD